MDTCDGLDTVADAVRTPTRTAHHQREPRLIIWHGPRKQKLNTHLSAGVPEVVLSAVAAHVGYEPDQHAEDQATSQNERGFARRHRCVHAKPGHDEFWDVVGSVVAAWAWARL